MIVAEYNHDKVFLTVYEQFTRQDLEEFENLIDYRIKFEGHIRVLIDLHAMSDFTLDVAWEELRFLRAHAEVIDQIAVTTDNRWLGWSAWLSRVFVGSKLQVFDERPAALAWLGQDGVSNNTVVLDNRSRLAA